jgi:hypothetical protein
MVHKTVQLERIAVCDRRISVGDEGYEEGDENLFHKEVPIRFDIAVHPSESGNIVINYPGKEESIDGYCGKYRNLADFVQEKGVGAVVRSGNHLWKWLSYVQSVQDDLRLIIDYAVSHSHEICGSENPSVFLMGFSGGSFATAAVAHEFPQVEKILLTGPAYGNQRDIVEAGLASYTGEVYILLGDNDHVLCGRAGRDFYDMAAAASRKELVVVRNCDHYFRHEVNDKIFSKAPLWAFAGETAFPSPEGGVRLVRK